MMLDPFSYETTLPEDMYTLKDKKQFDYCNEKLLEDINNDPELRKSFSNEQIEDIRFGDTPDGYTWHHNQEAGKMELVESDVHSTFTHRGGRSYWGGGGSNR
jgi:hypothetical protein